MAKKKSQIQLVIERMEADLIDVRRQYESTRVAMEAAIDRLREQQQKAGTRVRKPVAVKQPA